MAFDGERLEGFFFFILKKRVELNFDTFRIVRGEFLVYCLFHVTVCVTFGLECNIVWSRGLQFYVNRLKGGIVAANQVFPKV